MKVDLTNDVAVITGGGGVLGADFSLGLAMCGAKVAVLDLKLESAEKVAEMIVSKGGIAKAYQANCLDKNSLQSAASKILAELGQWTILVNGAGGNHPLATTASEHYNPDEIGQDFFNIDSDNFKFVFDINMSSAFLTTQVFAKSMPVNSRIINISSMNAFRPLTKIPAYSAAKAALSNFTAWLATYFAGLIRVNAIAPGFFASNQNRSLLYDSDNKPTARLQKILNATPLNRLGNAQELIPALLFLVDPDNSFVTGLVIPVDGGFSSYSGV